MRTMRETIRSTELEFEHRLFHRIRLVSRIFVILNWLVVLVILFLHEIPKFVTMTTFAVFRTTAVCATVWWMFEIAVALTGRTSAKNPFIDGILTLPMFGFWFLAWASSF
jgi:hypothetical protein